MQLTNLKQASWTKWMASAVLLFLVLVLASSFRLKSWANKYIDACDKAFGPLDQNQKDSINAIVQAFHKYGDKDEYKLAYILATARHESRFKAIKEYRAKSSQTTIYKLQNRYWYTGYYGRGFVQLTWERNYQKMSDFLGVDLVNNPDLALDPKYAAQILVYGMMKGSFTRRPLEEFINQDKRDFYNARKTINGLDKADLIQSYTHQILDQL